MMSRIIRFTRVLLTSEEGEAGAGRALCARAVKGTMNIKRDCHESLRDPAISGALTTKRRTPLAAGKSPNNGSIV